MQPKHQHDWQPSQINSGRQGTKKGQRSEGLVCSICHLNAKTPTNPKKGWAPPKE
jgi:hypothetical protein